MRLYDSLESGNCYKVRLLLAQLSRPYQLIEINTDRGESRTPEFLAKNPNGRVPLLETDDGVFLAESNAILWYLAEATELIPTSAIGRAQVLQWMLFEQYSHEPYVAVARYIMRHLADNHPRRAELPERRKQGLAAFSVMETHLQSRRFFVDETYSVADIALYAYSHVADQGGFDLAAFPAVRHWLERVASQPNYIAITDKPG
ncbi:MAG: glutathione S-transferase family protein [Proteobacteria bacterium]|nr:glutathione S-transferase family protein [Pseudomonadota bacterium]